MKKVLSIVAVATLFFATSCKTCYTCDCYGSSATECAGDTYTKDELKAQVALAESFGCDCKKGK